MPPIWNRRLGPSNKKELLDVLYRRSCGGDWNALALAYLVNELCPDDRTTKHVFGLIVQEKVS